MSLSTGRTEVTPLETPIGAVSAGDVNNAAKLTMENAKVRMFFLTMATLPDPNV
jgi:hypothetical protein